ncbi:T9SS type A sorting domain-containing protein [Dyadobacter sp. CY323]|uniref:T9SS type A sorting domain-containing protein n=1 Tax=Dyadobacter sp. CY323 TaxID=2907302 RepID=UPI001F26C33D|nr:T9SS type A sorting domain-containing protein [Dyadobacter sp. CY323]MCE6992884.1 T9SS type A sorting domain-containing protein [Dyadobacter sp. CY323]
MENFTSRLIRKLIAQKNKVSVLAVAILLIFSEGSYAQQYVQTSTGGHADETYTVPIVDLTYGAVGSVSLPARAEGAPDALFSTLNVEGLKISNAITIDSRAWVDLTMEAEVPAGKHTFVRISEPDFDGLSLDVSSLVDLLGLLTNNTVFVTTDEGTASSRFVRDPSNNLYLEVTSSEAYKTIRVTLDFGGSTDELGALLAAGTISLNVYHAVTYENGTYEGCAVAPIFTGLRPTTDLVNVGLFDLDDPHRAIDGNLSTFSVLRKDAGVLSNVSQTFYLGKTAPSTNEIVATISQTAGLLDATVLSSISIRAFNGTNPTPVASKNLGQLLLGVTLLNGFNAGDVTTIKFFPEAVYDRIVISSTTAVSALVSLNIHELGSRPPVIFNGGKLAAAMAGTAISRNLTSAISNTSPSLPGFSIGCGASTSFTYKFFEVSGPTGRVLAGTLPPSFQLSAGGVLTGSPTSTQYGVYVFDVTAINGFGQSDTTSFVINLQNPLPVTLVEFTARPEGRTTLLSWSTTMETNSDRFEIERSQTGKNWQKIGTVRSNQESTSLLNYSFTDSKPLDGANLYRLKMVDLDETFAYSQIKDVDFSASAYLYPNPVIGNENLIINAMDWSSIKQVKVINAMGKTVFEASNALSTGINTKNLAAGSYFVKMIHVNGSVSTHKFVRQ